MSSVESHATLKDAQFGQDNERDLATFQFLSENTAEVRNCNPIQPLNALLVIRLDRVY